MIEVSNSDKREVAAIAEPSDPDAQGVSRPRYVPPAEDDAPRASAPPQHEAVVSQPLKPVSKSVRTGMIAAAVVLVIAIAYAAWPKQEAAPTPVAQPATQARSDGTFLATPEQMAGFRIQTIEPRTFASVQNTDGRIGIDQDHSTPVFSPYSGRVVKVLASPGDQVKRGQALLQIEATEFGQGQNDLIAAAATLASSRAQQMQADLNEKRKHALYDAKAGSLQDWQQSQADLSAANGTLRSSEVALKLVRNRLRILGKSDADIAKLESAQRIDPVATVVAPIDGTVTDRQVGPGQYIQTGGSSALFTIGDLSNVWLIANVREADATLMKVGEAVRVRVLAIPDRVFDATLRYVGATVDSGTRRLPVRAVIANPDGLLKPEMFATFSIVTGDQRVAPAVPADAIVYEGTEARVWVVQDGNRVALREIRPGRTIDGMVEIRDGLRAGERVITSGTLFIDRAVRREMDQQADTAAAKN